MSHFTITRKHTFRCTYRFPVNINTRWILTPWKIFHMNIPYVLNACNMYWLVIIIMSMRVKSTEKTRLEIFLFGFKRFTKYSYFFINLLKPRTLIFLTNRFKTLLSFCPTLRKTFPRLIKQNFSLDFYEDL